MKKWGRSIKEEARQLRRDNLSITSISRILKVPRSTLHQWINDIKRPTFLTNQEKLEHLKRIRPMATLALKKEREERLSKIKKEVFGEIENFRTKDPDLLKSLLFMLYWSEGSKGRGTLQFANIDPFLSLLFLTLLRRCYKIDEAKLRVRLHLHCYHDIDKTRKFWSKLLNIPETKFGKIYIKKRSKTKKFRENFAGICFIRYYDENLRYRVLESAYELARCIVGYVPVAQLD